MRVLPALLSCCLLVAACGTGSVELSAAAPTELSDGGAVDSAPPASTTTSASSTTSATSRSTSTTTTSSTSTTTTSTAIPVPTLTLGSDGAPLNGQADGVVLTLTGWVVPVFGVTDDGWWVWTPCGRLATITTGKFIGSVDIVLDPGHGGSETGAVGPAGNREADINLQMSRRTRAALEAAGFSVLLTRDADVRLPIVTRAEIALALDPIAMISIHNNAGTDAPSAEPGTEMFFQVESAASKRLAGLLYEETRAVLDGYTADWVGMTDAGAMVRENREGGDYYGMLRRPGAVPSVIAEFVYIANASEEALLIRADLQDDLAGAVARAVERLVGTDDPGSGFTDDPIFRGYGPSGAGRTDNCDDPVLQ